MIFIISYDKMKKIKIFHYLQDYYSLKKRKIIVVSIFLFIGLLAWYYFAVSINPVIHNMVEVKGKSLTTKAINSAVADVVMNSVVYDDLINIITDELGNISMIQANSLEINNLSKDLAQVTEHRIEEYGQDGITIPLGTFSGIPIFVGTGPDVRIKVNPVGSVNCSFISQFVSAGINQTNHKIYLKVNASVGIVMPMSNKKIDIEHQILISESIIVGQVPEVYLYSDSLDTLLNFVPY